MKNMMNHERIYLNTKMEELIRVCAIRLINKHIGEDIEKVKGCVIPEADIIDIDELKEAYFNMCFAPDFFGSRDANAVIGEMWETWTNYGMYEDDEDTWFIATLEREAFNILRIMEDMGLKVVTL